MVEGGQVVEFVKTRLEVERVLVVIADELEVMVEAVVRRLDVDGVCVLEVSE